MDTLDPVELAHWKDAVYAGALEAANTKGEEDAFLFFGEWLHSLL